MGTWLAGAPGSSSPFIPSTATVRLSRRMVAASSGTVVIGGSSLGSRTGTDDGDATAGVHEAGRVAHRPGAGGARPARVHEPGPRARHGRRHLGGGDGGARAPRDG